MSSCDLLHDRIKICGFRGGRPNTNVEGFINLTSTTLDGECKTVLVRLSQIAEEVPDETRHAHYLRTFLVCTRNGIGLDPIGFIAHGAHLSPLVIKGGSYVNGLNNISHNFTCFFGSIVGNHSIDFRHVFLDFFIAVFASLSGSGRRGGWLFFIFLGGGVAEVMATLSSVTPHLLGATGNFSAETADFLELLSSPSVKCDMGKIDGR